MSSKHFSRKTVTIVIILFLWCVSWVCVKWSEPAFSLISFTKNETGNATLTSECRDYCVNTRCHNSFSHALDTKCKQLHVSQKLQQLHGHQRDDRVSLNQTFASNDTVVYFLHQRKAAGSSLRDILFHSLEEAIGGEKALSKSYMPCKKQ